jgi:hypothetical protein
MAPAELETRQQFSLGIEDMMQFPSFFNPKDGLEIYMRDEDKSDDEYVYSMSREYSLV